MNGNMRKVKDKKEKIEKLFPDEHRKYTFWSPKDSIEGKHKGYMLYAYGGYVLGLYLDNDELKVKLNVSDKYYEYSKSAETGALSETEYKDRLTPIESYILTGEEAAETGDAFDFAFKVCRNRAKGTAIHHPKRYLERMRETAIARKHSSTTSDFWIIEMESKMPVNGKKPDLIGIQITDNKPVFYFVEYKCTTGAMGGNQCPIAHLKDMAKYYNTLNLRGFESYAERLGHSADLSDAERKILFLFSNVSKTGKDGMTYQKAINGIEKLKDFKGDNEDFKGDNEVLENVRIAIIQDENDTIWPGKFYSIEDAVALLKEQKKSDK